MQEQGFLGDLASVSGKSGFSHQNVKIRMQFLENLGGHSSIPGPEELDRLSKQNPSAETGRGKRTRVRPTASGTLLDVELFHYYFLSPIS